MHKYFAEWERGIDLAIDSATLSSRAHGVDAVAAAISQGTVSVGDIVTLGFDPQRASLEVKESVRSAMRSADESFGLNSGDDALSAHAASGLAQVWETDPGRVGDHAAMAVLTRSADGALLPPRAPELVLLATSYLTTRSVEVRSTSEPGAILSPAQKGNLTKALNEAADDQSKVNQALVNHLTETAASADRTARALLARLRALEEESDIHWWVYNGASLELDASVSSLSKLEATLPLAVELSTLIRFLPAPLASRQFLRFALTRAKGPQRKASLGQVVNASPRAWREQLVQRLPSAGQITPILTAMARSLESETPEGWLATYKGATGIDPEVDREISVIAYLAFIEACLSKSMAEASDG